MPTYGTPGGGQTTASNTLTVTGITTSGSNTAIFAGVGSSAGTPHLTTSVTYNSVTLNEPWDFTAQANFHNSGHYLVAPAASGNLVVTVAGTEDELVLIGVPLADVHQTTPIGTVPSNANGSSATASVTVASAAGELVLAMLYAFWADASPGSGETTQNKQSIAASGVTGAVYSEAGAASVTISPTRASGANTQWLINAVSFKPATASGGAQIGGTIFVPTRGPSRGLRTPKAYPPAFAYVLTVGTGAYTLSGKAANLLYGRAVVVGTGTYTLSGKAANVLYSRVLPVGTGAYTLSGKAANLLYGRTLSVGTGVYTLSGKAVSFLKTSVLSVGTGVYVLNGQAVTLSKGRTLTVGTGAYTLSGQAVSLKHASVLPVGTGVYTLNGQAVTLSKGRTLTVGTGAYTLTGQSVSFKRTYVLSAGTGTFVLSGQDVRLVAPTPVAQGSAKVRPYRPGVPPIIPGGEWRFIQAENNRIASSVTSIIEALKAIEARLPP